MGIGIRSDSLFRRDYTTKTSPCQPASSAVQSVAIGVAARRTAGGTRGVVAAGGTQLSGIVRGHSADFGGSTEEPLAH
jgi:hypothetical protein